MCWACLKRGLIRVFVFEVGDLSPPKSLKREKKKPLRRRACVRGMLKIERTPCVACLQNWRYLRRSRSALSMEQIAENNTPCGGEIKHKNPPLQSFYHFVKTDQILCDILETARYFNKKSPQKWGLFLVKKGGRSTHEIFYQNSQTWDDVMCYNCERYL